MGTTGVSKHQVCERLTIVRDIVTLQIAMKIVTAEQMGQIDRQCADVGLPTSVLMENAGKAVAEEVRQILGTIDQQHILILIGPGNNGGDGVVTARHLHDWGQGSAYISVARDHQMTRTLG